MTKTNAKTKVAARAAGIVGGAMAVGLLMAATVPTSMRQAEGVTQTRGNPSYQADYTFDYALVDTGPEDLTPGFAADFAPGFSPANWSASEVSVQPATYDDSSQGLYDDGVPDDLLQSSDPQPAYEPLPVAVMVTRGSARDDAPAASDAAGRSADAAQAAAADVRAVENAVVQGPTELPAGPEAEQSAPVVTGT